MAAKKGFDPWEPKHDVALATGIIELIKAHKKELYLVPGIVGEVGGHGNSRVSSKIDLVLKAMAATYGVDQSVIMAGRAKGKTAGDGDGKAKPKAQGRKEKAKAKGKVQEEAEEEAEEEGKEEVKEEV